MSNFFNDVINRALMVPVEGGPVASVYVSQEKVLLCTIVGRDTAVLSQELYSVVGSGSALLSQQKVLLYCSQENVLYCHRKRYCTVTRKRYCTADAGKCFSFSSKGTTDCTSHCRRHMYGKYGTARGVAGRGRGVVVWFVSSLASTLSGLDDLQFEGGVGKDRRARVVSRLSLCTAVSCRVSSIKSTPMI